LADKTKLEWIVRDLPGAPVVRDYLAGSEAAVAFYGGHFGDAGAYRRKTEDVDGRFDADARARIAEAMYVPEGGDPDRLERWVEEGGYLVTTGQQPCLFGGPLYTIYKALSAARLARGLEDLVGRPVLPLFWIGSEDHDWAEANHTFVVDTENELLRAEVTRHEDTQPALYRIPLPEGVTKVVRSFVEALPDTDFSGPYRELLLRETKPGLTLPESCRGILGNLLGRFGVLLTHAAHPVVKERSREILIRELERGEEHEAILRATAARLDEAGYELQVSLLEGGLNLFYESDAGRERLYRDGDALRLHTTGTRFSPDELQRRAEEDPMLLSPNVLLRPVVESAVFPTLAYVAGPGEIAYFAQLRDYFQAFGMSMPVVQPRLSATIVETKIRKVLDKFELEPERLDRPFHELAGDLAREEIPDGVRKAAGSLRGGIAKGVSELLGEAKQIDPTLNGPVEHVRSQAFQALDELEKKVLQALKRENEIALAQVEKAQLHLYPDGKPQERMLNAFYYLARYGVAFLEDIYEHSPRGPA